MSCPKRPYKFLGIFKSFRDHDWHIQQVGVFMKFHSETFIVKEVCPLCGITRKRYHVEQDDLLKLGYTGEQLNEFKTVEI